MRLEPKFSDSIDRICKGCGELESECVCRNEIKILSNDSYKIKLTITKINGKIVSSIAPFYTNDTKEILAFLKKRFACGGSVKKGEEFYTIILQGKYNGVLEALKERFSFRI